MITWKPNKWIAAVLNLLVCPLGMLYVVKAKWALLYFCIAVFTIKVTEGLNIGQYFALVENNSSEPFLQN